MRDAEEIKKDVLPSNNTQDMLWHGFGLTLQLKSPKLLTSKIRSHAKDISVFLFHEYVFSIIVVVDIVVLQFCYNKQLLVYNNSNVTLQMCYRYTTL